MLKTIVEFNLFPENLLQNRSMFSPEQQHDLIHFREIGQTHTTQYITHRILREPSTSAPVRQHRLLTFGTKEKKRIKMSVKEREGKQIAKYLRQRLAWCNRTSQRYDPVKEQYSVYPRAICDEEGNPQKGAKSKWTEKLRKRYTTSNPPVLMNCLPNRWVPEAVLIDGMFIVQFAPLRRTATINMYAEFLYNRFVLTRPLQCWSSGSSSNIWLTKYTTFSPKCFERSRRDDMNTLSTHEHVTFTPSTCSHSKLLESANSLQTMQTINHCSPIIVLHSARND